MNKFELITDRTAEDVRYALEHQDSSENCKGAMNYSDFVRVDSKNKEIVDKLKSFGYNVSYTPPSRSPRKNDIVHKSNIDRIRTNLNNLNTFLASISKPSGISNFTFAKSLNYIEVNKWESLETFAFEVIQIM